MPVPVLANFDALVSQFYPWFSDSVSPPKGLFRSRSDLQNNLNKIKHRLSDEEDVDVEQWSDSEEPKMSPKISAKIEGSGPTDNSTVKQEPPPPKKKKEDRPKYLKPKCNCEELLHVDCYLETKELWDKFNELGTEMIITKTGR